MDGKSKAWRNAADQLLEALARENKYIVADMVQIFLESAGYGLTGHKSYSALGGVFKRAAKRGIISRVDRKTKQTLWISKIYGTPKKTIVKVDRAHMEKDVADIHEGKLIWLENFGGADGHYKIVKIEDKTVSLEAVV